MNLRQYFAALQKNLSTILCVVYIEAKYLLLLLKLRVNYIFARIEGKYFDMIKISI